MKKKIAEEWAARLRSGDYTQQIGGLKRMAGEAPKQTPCHCFTGVLAEMAVEDGIAEWGGPDMESRLSEWFYIVTASCGPYDGRCYLPKEVLRWAGLTKKGMNLCINENDDKQKSFPVLANWLDKHWKEL